MTADEFRLLTVVQPVPPRPGADPELDAVQAELDRLDPAGLGVATVLRDTLDQIYDGQHTGRWNYDQLHKTEKTHMGTLVEINLHRQFGFQDGEVTDYRIAGIEVDCKYSMSYGGWELPPEAVGQLCLLLTANDAARTWSAGLLRIRADDLRGKPNRDAKRQLTAASRGRIRRLWRGPPRRESVPCAGSRRQGPDLQLPVPSAASSMARRGRTSCSAACSGGSSGGPSWPPWHSRMIS